VEPADEKIISSSRKNGFCIITRHRTYDLFAESAAEMKEWMDIISSVVTSRSRIAEIKVSPLEESDVRYNALIRCVILRRKLKRAKLCGRRQHLERVHLLGKQKRKLLV